MHELTANEYEVYLDILEEMNGFNKPLKELVTTQYLKTSSWTKVEAHCHAIRKILNRESCIKISRQLRLFLKIIK